MRRARTAIAGLAVALALGGGWIWTRAEGVGDASSAPPAPQASSERPVPPPRFAPAPAPAFAAASEPQALDEEGPGPHFEFYGGRSGRMSRHSRPSEPYEPGEVTSLGAAPKLVAWMDPDRDGAATLKLFARIGGPTITDLTVRAEINVRERPDRSLRVTLAPTQVPGEFVAELAKTAPELQPTPSVELAPPTALKFVVTATGRDGSTPFTRRVAGDFLVSDPGARLDEQSARVAQVGGDLVLAIVVDVRRAGTYWAMAELFGGPDGDRPVAFARQRLPRLEPGRHRIELLFGGRIIRDGRVDGPYRVVNVRLAQPDTIPPHFAPFVRALPPTPPWKADQFGAGA